MSHLFWLDHERLNRIKHMFPKPRGVARADDRKVLSGIIDVIRNGLAGETLHPIMCHTRRSTTDGHDGPRWVSLLTSLPNWSLRGAVMDQFQPGVVVVELS